MDYNNYYNEVMHHEWVLSNDKGGYSMGYGNFVNSRKYNGLLISADKKLARKHLVQSQEEKIRWRNKEIYLDSNNYSECIYPNGYEHIVKTWFHPFPTVIYSSIPKYDDFIVIKKIKMHSSKNLVKVSFANLSPKAVELTVRPKFSLRDHNSVNDPGLWDRISITTKINANSFEVKRDDTGIAAYVGVSAGEIEEEKIIFRNVFYPRDSTRGYDATESLISPVKWTFKLHEGETAYILYSDKVISDINKASREIDKRYSSLVLPVDHPDKIIGKYSLTKINFDDENIFPVKKYPDLLSQIFETFLMKDDIIAGFPWFSAWGRDTMISMKALLYHKNGLEKYLKILDKYGKKLKNGILPNIIGEGGQGTNYDTVDASLWFAVRLFDCYSLINDENTKKKLFGYLTEIVGHYAYNKSLPFFTDENGFIQIKPGDHALTWMDAKVYNQPITPRWGNPVEINSLWYNALKTFEFIAKDLNEKTYKTKKIKFENKDIKLLIKKVGSNAGKFVINGHLADRIENNNAIDEFRPNMLIAASLPFDLWDEDILLNSWMIAKEELATPYGMRTLSPRNSSFKKKYIGNHTQLDIAYHQGTVWAWLLGPFVLTFYKTHKKKMKKAEIKENIDIFVENFKKGILKGHIASVAEVWDGDTPHFPKGCPAQAWSVSSLIEIEHIFDKAGVIK